MFGALAEFVRSRNPRTHPSRPRPLKLTENDIEAAKALLANRDIGATQIAHRVGGSPATLYRYIPTA
jgi:hypothetical protein